MIRVLGIIFLYIVFELNWQQYIVIVKYVQSTRAASVIAASGILKQAEKGMLDKILAGKPLLFIIISRSLRLPFKRGGPCCYSRWPRWDMSPRK